MSARAATPFNPETDTPAIVIFGKGEDGKPRASWFAKPDAAHARTAAKKMGLRILVIKSTELQALAHRVPKGRIFASGKAFTPLIQHKVFLQLDGLVPQRKQSSLTLVASDGPGEADKSAGGQGSEAKGEGSQNKEGHRPPDWARIRNGSMVLAYSPDDEAWFEALVIESKPNNKFVLRWRDYPDDPTVTYKRHELALLFPEGNAAA